MTGQPRTETTPPPSRSRRRAWLVVALVGAAIALAAGGWWWLRPRPPQPPLADLSWVDPEAAEVIADARRAVLSKPSSGRAWGHLAMVLRAHDFEDASLECFEQAEQLDPREPRWPYLRGLTSVATDPDAGIALLERAVALCQDEPLAPRLRLAEALLEWGRLDEAQGHLEAARRIEPENTRLLLGLAKLALLRGDWRTAQARLEKPLKDEHSRKLAHNFRAEAWARLGETDRSRADQAKAETLPDDVRWPDPFADEVLALQRGLDARLQEVDSLAKTDRHEDAIAVLEDTVQKYPKSLQTWWRLGGLWLQVSRFDKAEKAFEQAIKVDPEAAESWFRLGNVQAATKRPREAIESFRRAIQLRPSHALAHFNMAHRLREQGDLAGAASEFRATLRCWPDYAPARSALDELEKVGQDKDR